MNHDGHFGNFYADVHNRGALPATPDPNAGALVAERAFDGSPVYSDYSCCRAGGHGTWRAAAARGALLQLDHPARRQPPRGRTRKRRQCDLCRTRRRLFEDLGRFLDELQRSGRRVVLVLVPEHGAAVRGDRRQIPGMREVPTPSITEVPVAVAIIGAGVPAQPTVARIDSASSYLALSELAVTFRTREPV